MTRILPAVVCACFALGLSAMEKNIKSSNLRTEDYIPATEGLKLKYKVYDGNEKFVATYIMALEKVEGDMKQGKVVFSYDFYDADGKAKIPDGKKLVITCNVNNGETTSSIDELSVVTKVMEFMPKGDISHLPGGLKAGDKVQDGYVTTKVGGLNTSFTVKERKVVSEKKVKVPAGEFNCIELVEKQFDKTVFTKEFTVRSFYTEKYSLVEQWISDKKGKPVLHIVLVDSNVE